MCDLVLIVWSLLGLCVGILTHSMHEERAKYPAHAYIAPKTTDFHRHSGKSCFHGHGVIDWDSNETSLLRGDFQDWLLLTLSTIK